jgi:uncharacterized protein
MELIKSISEKLNLPPSKVKNTVDLLKDDNTIPFIARYRKEITGNLDEVQIREIEDLLGRLENLENRRQSILKTIEGSGRLTQDLKQQILEAESLTLLEDLYQPFRPKKRTKAMAAREKGLAPLAEIILSQPSDNGKIKDIISPFINDQVPNLSEALEGASDIVAEITSENTLVRQLLREQFSKLGEINVSKHPDGVDERKVFQDYYQFRQPLKGLRHYQVLAINRGEKEKILSVTIDIDKHIWQDIIFSQYPPNLTSLFHQIFIAAIQDGAKRLLLPSIVRDIRREINESAEDHAIKVFANNLKSLFSQPPISEHIIIGIDPGFRTGCKVAVIDPNGKLLDTATIYPHPPQKQLEQAYGQVLNLINLYGATLLVIGNGTASRETEAFIAEITKKDKNLHYLITSEAGASVYSASETARREFPDLDVSMRGAVSIARRVQDPLAEFVKIDPRSIGVGLYQHDVNQTKLTVALNQVIESVVNAVGVEINTASMELLSHISGIGPGTAEKVVNFRETHGGFGCRDEIMEVPGIGSKTFQQSAGFLRVRDSNNPLDNTGIHPESYQIAFEILEKLDIPKDASSDEISAEVNKWDERINLDRIAKELKVSIVTVEDILNELAHPGRDPRNDLPKPILRNDVLSMDDLSQGMEIKGTIRNVVDFGAFVDIGVKIDGLLHRSRIPKNCNLKVGDVIDLRIVSIDNDRNRIALSMKESFDK